MRLSDEKARRLNALVWRERARRILPVIVVAVGAIALLTFFLVRQVEHADRTLDVRVHQATVVHVKKSGNGREWGEHGLRDFLEVKAVIGAEVA